MLPKEHRLRQSSRIKYIYRVGRTVHTSWFVLNAYPNKSDISRFAFVSSKKVGGAVERNRANRLFRHAVRAVWGNVPIGFDFVIVAKQRALTRSLSDLTQEVARAIIEVTTVRDQSQV